MMIDDKEFGKCQSHEELQMLRELNKYYNEHPVKHKKRRHKSSRKKIRIKEC